MRLTGNRVAAYARYSSDKQSESSIEDQLRRFRELLAREGRTLDERLTLTDYAISGASTNRPGFDALMAMVRRREIDVLLVEDVSRLARNQSDATRLYEELAFYGVQLIALGDGIDTQHKGAKLQFGVKALFAEVYLDDLRDKTRRGMEGRAHAKLATGGRTIGYRTVRIPTDDPRRSAGSRIEIDPDAAPLVRSIFALYVGGGSFNSIAATLNAEKVPSPRDRTRHGRKHGWSPSTIRAILMNTRYVGLWTFGARQWIKAPGTNKRVPRLRDASEVIRDERPELRIIDADTWERAQAKLAATARMFTRTAEGARKGKALPGGDQAHPLSGLLRCECGAPFTIYGGGAARRYYVCAAFRRGRCEVERVALMAELARACVIRDLKDFLFSDAGVARMRRRIVDQIRGRASTRSTEVEEARARLDRTEKRVANVVAAIAAGEYSTALSAALRDLEAQAEADRRLIADLERQARQPVALPSPDAILRNAMDLERRLAVNPAAARDELHRLFRDRAITLELGEDGVYVGKSEIDLSGGLQNGNGAPFSGGAVDRLW